MPQDSQTSPSAAPAALMSELVDMLATVLRLKAEKIDAEQTFQSLGLDSLLSVELVATVNARYGTAVKPDALFDHPTPLELARHVARERGCRVRPPPSSPLPRGAARSGPCPRAGPRPSRPPCRPRPARPCRPPGPPCRPRPWGCGAGRAA